MCNNNDDYDDDYGYDGSENNAERNNTEYKSDLRMEIVCNSDRDTVS
jgi:hypothetical protein